MSVRLNRALALVVVSGLLGSTVVVLTAGTADAAGRALQRGSRGAGVMLLESRLHRLRLLPKAAVDRRYTRATVHAVKRFQRRQHVRATGRTDRRTWNLVAKRAANRTAASPPAGPAPRIIGHRGAIRPGVPENTMASLRYATGWADVLEFDLRLTADHQFVLMHDSVLGRATDCAGPVSSWSSADLREQCRVAGEPIPTFEEVAAHAASTSATIAPELKNSTISDADLTTFVEVLRRHGLIERTSVQTFRTGLLPRVRALEPALATVLCATEPPSLPAVRGSGATHVAVQLANLTGPRVALYRRNGVSVWAFTARDRAGLDAARARGVDAVVTDIPRQARLRFGS